MAKSCRLSIYYRPSAIFCCSIPLKSPYTFNFTYFIHVAAKTPAYLPIFQGRVSTSNVMIYYFIFNIYD